MYETISNQQSAKHGFTLVELSIALVIVGLLIGGLLVGQSLIDSAKLTKQISIWNQTIAGMNSFKMKFKYLPGDIPMWGFTGNSNFRGDGDGTVHNPNNQNHINGTERSKFFIDLQGSGMARLAKNLTPALAWGGMTAEPAKGYIPMLLDDKNTGWIVSGVVSNPTNGSYSIPGNYIIVVPSNSSGYVYWPTFPTTPITSAAVDTKIDDGAPFTGSVKAYKDFYGTPADINGSCVDANSKYKLSVTTKTCGFYYKID